MTHIASILGIPVYFSDKCMTLACAEGIFHKRIVVGPRWMFLPMMQQCAVLLHEAHHCRARHREIRYLLALFCWIPAVERIAQRQELEADRFAVESGYGQELYSIVAAYTEEDEFHPPNKVRLQHIEQCMKGVSYAIQ